MQKFTIKQLSILLGITQRSVRAKAKKNGWEGHLEEINGKVKRLYLVPESCLMKKRSNDKLEHLLERIALSLEGLFDLAQKEISVASLDQNRVKKKNRDKKTKITVRCSEANSEPTLRSNSEPTLRSNSEPTLRSNSEPTLRSNSEPWDPKKFGEWRKGHSISQAKLAKSLSVQKAKVGRWEKGIESPTSNNMIQLRKLGFMAA